MKKNTGNKIRLGIFVLAGLVVLTATIYFIGEKQQLFGSTFRISGIFKDISGLQVGNNVRFAGITVGVVENITIVADTSVQVDMIIDEETRKFIRRDSKAIIGSDGLMGNKILVIMPGTPGQKPIKDGETIGTTLPINMDDILMKLQATNTNAAQITEDLALIMGDIRSGKGTIGKLFVDPVFAQKIDRTVVNLNEGAVSFKKVMDAASESWLIKGIFNSDDDDEEKKKEEKEAKEAKDKKEEKDKK